MPNTIFNFKEVKKLTDKFNKMEQISNITRSEDYENILAIVKKLKLEKPDLDAYDHPSVAYELEQLFLKNLHKALVSGSLPCEFWQKLSDKLYESKILHDYKDGKIDYRKIQEWFLSQGNDR